MPRGPASLGRIAGSLLVLVVVISALAVLLPSGPAGLNGGPVQGLTSGRNPYQWPFAANSVWNLPIGAGATYVAAHIKQATSAGMTTDPDVIILTPTAPSTAVYQNNDGWSGGSRCSPQGGVLFNGPIPTAFVVPGATSSSTPNYATAILMPDNHTLAQGQPMARCTAGGPATMMWYNENEDLYGFGFSGGHGGSMLSSIGGTIRLGELVPGGVIRHALKVNLYAHDDYYYDGITKGYRWPATTADSYASSVYGGSIPALRMGSLLALPASLSISSMGLETQPARILAQAFQDYGAYTVDDTGWSVYAIETEFSPNGKVEDQFQSAWGFSMTPSSKSTPWSRDMDRIFGNLSVVDDWNQAEWITVSASNGTLGAGGGAPLVAWAPPIGSLLPPLTADFTFTPTNPKVGQSIAFTGTASGGTLSYSFGWTFGDGSTGSGATLSHSYASAGNYTVTLTVTDAATSTVHVSHVVAVLPASPLTASFSYSPTSPTAGQTITFTASVLGGTSPYSYAWAFGDTHTATGAQVTHAYANAGNYTVTLTVTDAATSTVHVSHQVAVLPASPLTASFTFTPTGPQAGQSVAFTGTASGGRSPYSFAWTFGDGATGSGATVSHGYAQSGNYTVTLTVTDAATSTVHVSHVVAVSAPPPPTASFTFSPTSPVAGQTITFNATASGGTPPYSYAWTFGDNHGATGAQVTHAYASAGNYTVTLTVTDAATSTVHVSHLVAVSPPPPLTAGFAFTPTNPQVGQSVAFTGTASGGAPSYSFAWTFGDGATGSGASVGHAYAQAGNYTVVLTVRDAGSQTSTATRIVTVTAPPPPVNKVTVQSPTSGAQVTPGQPVTVSWTSSGSLQAGSAALSYSADGGATWGPPFATGQPLNGSFVWNAPSVTTNQAVIRVVVKDAGGNNVEGRSGEFIIGPIPAGGFPVARLSYSPAWPEPTTTVTFDASASAPSSPNDALEARWDWQTDGIWDTPWSASLVVQHTYGAEGTVVVHLEVMESSGAADNATVSLILDGTPPVTSANIAGKLGTGGWYVSNVTVSLSATDAGSGVASTFFRVDGNASRPYSAPFSLGNGKHEVDFYSVDRAGVAEAVQALRVRVDSSHPAFRFASPTGVVSTSVVQISWDATDTVSSQIEYATSVDGGPFVDRGANTSVSLILPDGDHSVVVRATAASGNQAETTITFRVDTNLFSFTGPYHGGPTIGLIAAALLLIGLAAAMRRRKTRRARKRNAANARSGYRVSRSPAKEDVTPGSRRRNS